MNWTHAGGGGDVSLSPVPLHGHQLVLQHVPRHDQDTLPPSVWNRLKGLFHEIFMGHHRWYYWQTERIAFNRVLKTSCSCLIEVGFKYLSVAGALRKLQANFRDANACKMRIMRVCGPAFAMDKTTEEAKLSRKSRGLIWQAQHTPRNREDWGIIQ